MRLSAVELKRLTKGTAVLAADLAQVVKTDGKPTRWRLNSGARMRTMVGGIGEVELVIDLAGVAFDHPSMPMLREHGRRPSSTPDDYYITAIGRWEGVSVDSTGIWGQPIVYTPDPTKPLEADMPSLREGGEVAALMERGHPWQASVKITGEYELVAPGQPAVVNGRTEIAADDLDAPPLLICRRGTVSEASVCTFGADSQTGAAAASRITTTQPTDSTMSTERLSALLKRHGEKHAAKIAVSLAANKTDDQISVELAAAVESDHAAALSAEQAKTSAVQAKLDAEVAKSAGLQAKLDALKTDPAAMPTDEKTPAAGKGESQNSAPKTWNDGVAILKKEDPKLSGFKLRTAVLSRFPTLRKEIPAAV
ncbi:MAG TPA: hypothetical protein VHX44_03480 [Planctomycetota bacterium]|jgi:hypothetical protein|nr:hypothetical protein [Planctomycetota bacterium]